MSAPATTKQMNSETSETSDRYKKGLETRRKNIEARKKAEEEAFLLVNEINALKQKLADLKVFESIILNSPEIGTKILATEYEIVQASATWENTIGVYFLISKGRVVYIGQSRNVYERISVHKRKEFDSYAIIGCKVEHLDIIESLYIHILKPPLNGRLNNGVVSTPLSLDSILNKLCTKTPP